MKSIQVWDIAVRLFHWSLVIGFGANALIVDPESALHQQIGYAILVLVGCRIVWGFVGTRHARFADFPPSVAGAVEHVADIARSRRKVHVGHNPLGAWMIYNLLLTLLVIAGSGWLMTTNAYWGVAWPAEVHETAVTWAEVSVVVHIVAAILESRRTGVNLPRAMITGVKRIPER
ncbi:cytochrome b/b6 domain-containing protein [Aquicoccus sp. G2-2]|uniref:cytochrome b/b6 domain-containing protein n=1 Tax=Aquicoccus sp. G2-2 TaxID=3092120 RepID=UPI002ADFF094|nr:cytochrome b/b6 domain-containing protein [Aquicoccus sp. G2-2]MEA1112881.1 cytochrome b/b6 domain-containing protein [Aquicoccus sp. G2-2]